MRPWHARGSHAQARILQRQSRRRVFAVTHYHRTPRSCARLPVLPVVRADPCRRGRSHRRSAVRIGPGGRHRGTRRFRKPYRCGRCPQRPERGRPFPKSQEVYAPLHDSIRRSAPGSSCPVPTPSPGTGAPRAGALPGKIIGPIERIPPYARPVLQRRLKTGGPVGSIEAPPRSLRLDSKPYRKMTPLRFQDLALNVTMLIVSQTGKAIRGLTPLPARQLLKRMTDPSIEQVRRTAGRINLWRLARRRYRYAHRHLSGEGLEIGALNFPLKVPPHARVRYVDRATKEQSIRDFPALDPPKLVEPNFIEDGFTLASIPAASQSFVIACHVLEHSPNPLQALENWWRVLAQDGVLLLVVPLCDQCFDHGRALTTLAHMVEDYDSCAGVGIEGLARRNLQHYVEWLTVSTPNIQKTQPPSADDVASKANELAEQRAEIHFHTFSTQSFRELLAYFSTRPQTPSTILDVVDLGSEALGIVRRTSRSS